MRQGQEDDLGLFGQQFGLGLAEVERPGAWQVGEFGKTWATVWPANWRDVTAANSARGWPNSSRTSSSPE